MHQKELSGQYCNILLIIRLIRQVKWSILMQIIIFGASNTGKKAFQYLRTQYEVIAFCDNNIELIGKKLFDIPIISPNSLGLFHSDFIVIASLYHIEIVKQLYDMGIKNARLFHLTRDEKSCMLLELNSGSPFQDIICREPKIKACDQKHRSDLKFTKKRKVLVIAYFFPPAGGSPIQRTLKFVKYLREYGYEPIVLTTEINPDLNKYSIDQSLLNDIPEKLQIIRIKDDYTWPDVISKEKAQEVIEFLYSVSGSKEWISGYIDAQNTQNEYILPDNLILWANECIRHIDEYIDMRDIDLIYSTVPEWSPHLIAYFLKQKYGIKWIADYRDPWVSNRDYINLYYPWMTEKEISVNQYLERKLVKDMDLIVVAGGKWISDFVNAYGVKSSGIKEITNGYDEEDFLDLPVKTEKNKKFTLCYNGGIAYNRNPVPVLKVINFMIEQNEVERDEIQWIFNGLISSDYLKKINKEDIHRVTVQNGILTHTDSIKIAMESDIMVMYGEFGEKGYLNYPGKFYEYLRIGKPILCFSSHESFQADVLRETKLGVNMDLYDFEGIKNFLRSQIELWRTDKKSNIDHKESIQKYERKLLTHKLAKEFDHVLNL